MCNIEIPTTLAGHGCDDGGVGTKFRPGDFKFI